MTDGGDGNWLRVIEGGREGEPVVRTSPDGPRETRYCLHPSMDLQKLTRQVICRDCKTVIDPFDAVVKVANEWERHAHWTAMQVQERKRAEEHLANVKREIKNAQARLRRANEKASRG